MGKRYLGFRPSAESRLGLVGAIRFYETDVVVTNTDSVSISQVH